MTSAATLPRPTAGYRRVVECMGTVFSFDIRTPGVGAAAVDEAEQWLRDVDATFSTYRADSEISRLERGEITMRQCSADVRTILAECEHLAVETGGWFSMYATGRLDPSGLVKGWAIERASDILARHGSIAHSVNGGGDVQCAGDAAVGRPWRTGIAHPLLPGRLAGVVVGTGLAVATSGSAERGAHVLDPHTGRPPDGLASVTVVGRRLAYTDAYATAAYAMGHGAQDFVEGLAGYAAFGVRVDGAMWCTSGWGNETGGSAG
ncbi:MAG: FAD:protein transferase [Pseudonocardiales bacterium]|nr:FAD:protein transferase [Pseudonocardiales bacterium]